MSARVGAAQHAASEELQISEGRASGRTVQRRSHGSWTIQRLTAVVPAPSPADAVGAETRTHLARLPRRHRSAVTARGVGSEPPMRFRAPRGTQADTKVASWPGGAPERETFPEPRRTPSPTGEEARPDAVGARSARRSVFGSKGGGHKRCSFGHVQWEEASEPQQVPSPSTTAGPRRSALKILSRLTKIPGRPSESWTPVEELQSEWSAGSESEDSDESQTKREGMAATRSQPVPCRPARLRAPTPWDVDGSESEKEAAPAASESSHGGATKTKGDRDRRARRFFSLPKEPCVQMGLFGRGLGGALLGKQARPRKKSRETPGAATLGATSEPMRPMRACRLLPAVQLATQCHGILSAGEPPANDKGAPASGWAPLGAGQHELPSAVRDAGEEGADDCAHPERSSDLTTSTRGTLPDLDSAAGAAPFEDRSTFGTLPDLQGSTVDTLPDLQAIVRNLHFGGTDDEETGHKQESTCAGATRASLCQAPVRLLSRRLTAEALTDRSVIFAKTPQSSPAELSRALGRRQPRSLQTLPSLTGAGERPCSGGSTA